MNKKILMGILGTVLVFGMTVVGCDNGSGGSGNPVYLTFEAADNASLASALSQIKADDAPNGGEYTIKITADISANGKLISGSKYNGKNIILKGESAERAIQYTSSPYTLFEVFNGTLTLDENITLKGIAENTRALLLARDDGVIVINDGAKITGNTNTTGGDPDGEIYRGGGAIELRGGGKLYMYGGEISNNNACRGAGVAIFGGTFIMEDGVIQNNNTSNTTLVSNGGGVHLNFEGDVFTMNGGSIKFNKAVVNGGGVSVCCGTFTMNGASLISDNEAGVTGGGVGVCCNTFIMNGGTIARNKAATGTSTAAGRVIRYGGGVGRWGSANTTTFPLPGKWDAPVIFHKYGGVIYGSDAGENSNTVKNVADQSTVNLPGITGNVKGDAIFLLLEYEDNTVTGEYHFVDNKEHTPADW